MRVQLACLAVGTLWVPVLAAMCLTSGELKMRGTFFDETTLTPLASRATLDGSLDRRMRQCRNRTKDVCGLVSKDNPWRGHGGATQGIARPLSGAPALDGLAIVAIGDPALPFVLAVASFLAEAPWLAKNIVVVSAPSILATREWIDAYIRGVDDMDRGGILRAALVFQQSDTMQTIQSSSIVRLKAHGANGAAPNLDLVQLATTALAGLVRIDTCCVDRCSDVIHDNTNGPETSETPVRYVDRLIGLAYYICGILEGPNGAHALFLERAIDALTLEIDFASSSSTASSNSTTIKSAPGAIPLSLERVAVGVELILRSLNTVEHKLHHSFFLYWLATPWHFVSLDEYAWPLMFLLTGTFGVSAFIDMDFIVFHDVFSSGGVRVACAVLGPFAMVASIVEASPGHDRNMLLVYGVSWLFFVLVARLFATMTFDVAAANAILSFTWGCLHVPFVMANPPLLLVNGILGGAGWLVLWRNPRLAMATWFLYGSVLFGLLPITHLRRNYFVFDDWTYATLTTNCIAIHAASGAVRFFSPLVFRVLHRRDNVTL